MRAPFKEFALVPRSVLAIAQKLVGLGLRFQRKLRVSSAAVNKQWRSSFSSKSLCLQCKYKGGVCNWELSTNFKIFGNLQ